jgi:hypothetical protein
MNTYTITIGSLALIGTGFSILLTLKYITLKTYYKRKCQRHDVANETIVELQERIETMSQNIDYLKDRIKRKEKEYLSLKNKTR